MCSPGLPPEENVGGWGDDAAALSRTHSQKLSEYRRKYSDAMESRTSHAGAPPGEWQSDRERQADRQRGRAPIVPQLALGPLAQARWAA
eukprot:COSAG03_NODE_6322_length_1079_cov_0.562245_2_plen_88_part_01